MTNPATKSRPIDLHEAGRSASGISRYRLLALAFAGVLGLSMVPFFGVNDSVLLTMSTIFMWIILSSSWNFISGFTGYVDFGHGVFFGVGGYVTGILVTKAGLPFAPTVPMAALFSAALALIIGYPLLRLRGVYFSIAMLGLFLAIRELSLIAKPLTAGAQGIILPSEVDRVFFYYLFFIGAVLVVSLAWWLRRSQFGLSLLAIKDDEYGAEARGVNTTLLKLTVFCLSAAITGSVGACWAYEVTFIDPGIMFRDSFLINVAIMATLGGLGTVWGPVIGSVVFLLVRDTLWADQGNSFLVVFGVFLIVLVLFMPEGIVGTIERGERTVLGRLIRRLRHRGSSHVDISHPAIVPAPVRIVTND
ncbi:MAG: branched-chain amino acid ABC transporter permease [Candidimonas sp.]|nr:MAG: branched-chain amino acid ABC transporter permease [Candidimonas sp.]TAM26050.1 MAG: branched-chain amino acid ABC transporter permease [Candidimonas sp.]